MKQIPPGPKDIYCPLWRKPMSKVCHTCAFYVELEQKAKDGSASRMHWTCSIPAQVAMQSETKTQVIQHAAATESLRNELIRSTENTLAAAETFQAVTARRDPKLIDLNPRGKA
jgi:hypothetical protein